MVDLQDAQLDSVFHALANPTRRLILGRLATGDETVGGLAQPFKMSLAAVSKHVLVLEAADLVERTREGRETHCRLKHDALEQAADALEHYRQFWTSQLDALEQHLGTSAPKEDT